jgi:putative ABC transport system permease protein
LNLITLALRNLQRRLGRSLIVSGSVGLALGSALSLLTLADSVERSASEGATERGGDLIVLSKSAADFLSGFLPEEIGKRLSKIPGVEATTSELVTLTPIDQSQHKLVTGWPIDSFHWKEIPIISGQIPTAGNQRGAVLGAGVAEALHKKVGDEISLFDTRFKVIGIANYQTGFNRSITYVPLGALQEAAFRQNQVTLFALKLNPKISLSQIESIKSEIGKMPSLIATPTERVLQHDRSLELLRAISRAISLIALIMGSLSVLNTMLMAVHERTREIGIMIAIGWPRARTMASIVFEAFLIGMAGSLVGIPLSYGISLLFQRLPTIGDILSIQMDLGLVLPAVAASIFFSCLGAVYPAWHAASMKPADALRRV